MKVGQDYIAYERNFDKNHRQVNYQLFLELIVLTTLIISVVITGQLPTMVTLAR